MREIMVIEIDTFNFELRKIIAIKNKNNNKNSNRVNKQKKSEKNSFPSEINVFFKQKKDKNTLEFSAFYKIPSILEYGLEIDAEFIGTILLKESFDIDKEKKDSSIFKDFLNSKVFPKIFKDMDNILSPIFKNMNVKYNSIAKEIEKDLCEFENNT